MPKESVIFAQVKDECDQIINLVCAKHFKGTKDYNQTIISTQIAQVNEEIVNSLVKCNDNFKYLITS